MRAGSFGRGKADAGALLQLQRFLREAASVDEAALCAKTSHAMLSESMWAQTARDRQVTVHVTLLQHQAQGSETGLAPSTSLRACACLNFGLTVPQGYVEDFMGYGVELSSRTANRAPPPKKRTRGRRRIDRTEILEAAFKLLAEQGEAGFSVRKAGAAAGVDPMTVLHHFQSKDILLRALADKALSTVTIPLPSGDWRKDLLAVANAYRDLARRYPNIFHLHFRFNATGPADHASSEIVYRAMRETGLPDAAAAGLGLAFYAFVLGFALAEVEGLLVPLSPKEEEELNALDPLGYPATRAFIPAFKKLDAQAAFNSAFSAFIAGIAARAKV